jgi:hypothetical protein
MLVTFQFPISDARWFDSDPDLRLKAPDWPNPATDIHPQFVHRFGRAVARRRDADLAWPDETKYCQAHRALRLERLETRHAGLPGYRFKPRCAFRRLFSDGGAVARVEVGLVHDPREEPLTGMTAAGLLAVIAGLCEIPAKVEGSGGAPRTGPIIRQGPELARLYAKATLSRKCGTKCERAMQLVEAGSPLVLVEVEPGETLAAARPEGFLEVPTDGVLGAGVEFGRVRTRGGTVGVWILHPWHATPEQLRSLRLCLLRLHAEQEALDLILKQLHRGRLKVEDDDAAERLNEYFNARTRLINRREWAGIRQSAILGAFDAAEQVTPPGTRAGFVARYEGARQQVWKKVEEYQARRLAARMVPVVNVQSGGTYVEKSVTVSGSGNIVNVAEFISGVTNTVNSNLKDAPVDDQVKTLVKELTDQIAAIAPKADPKLTQRMGGDLQTLTSEMKQEEPRRKWYEMSLDGLKEAAVAVGELAAPIMTTIGKLTPLLLK